MEPQEPCGIVGRTRALEKEPTVLPSAASSLRLSRPACEKEMRGFAAGLPGALSEKTVWKPPALSQATRSLSVHESYYFFVSI